MKRAKMPKKSKHRMRAHINPMGDLTIPVYVKKNYTLDLNSLLKTHVLLYNHFINILFIDL